MKTNSHEKKNVEFEIEAGFYMSKDSDIATGYVVRADIIKSRQSKKNIKPMRMLISPRDAIELIKAGELKIPDGIEMEV